LLKCRLRLCWQAIDRFGSDLGHAVTTDAKFNGIVLTDVSVKDALCPAGEEMLWNDDPDGV